MAYIKINYDDSKPALELIELPTDIRKWLVSVYEYIGADTIDIANTQFTDLVLVVDDCGKLHDNWHERINAVATKLHGSVVDPIVGDCILGRRYHDTIEDLTEFDIDLITKYFS